MNHNSHYSFKAIASAILLSGALATQATATVTALNGSLVAAFYEIAASGTSTEANTYIVNLGSVSALREGALSTTLNLNADLTTAFGADWATTGTVRWAIVGVIGSGDPLTNGDPSRTTYYSRDSGGVMGSASPISLSSTQRGTLTTQISSFFSPLNTGIPENGAVDGGAIRAASSPNSITSFLPPTQTTNFGLSLSPVATAGTLSSLDIFRTLHSASGADLTAAASPGNAVVGAGQYVGSFTLDNLGNLSNVPEPTVPVFLVSGLFAGLIRRRRPSTMA